MDAKGQQIEWIMMSTGRASPHVNVYSYTWLSYYKYCHTIQQGLSLQVYICVSAATIHRRLQVIWHYKGGGSSFRVSYRVWRLATQVESTEYNCNSVRLRHSCECPWMMIIEWVHAFYHVFIGIDCSPDIIFLHYIHPQNGVFLLLYQIKTYVHMILACIRYTPKTAYQYQLYMTVILMSFNLSNIHYQSPCSHVS